MTVKTVSHLVRFIFEGLNNQDAEKAAFYNYLRAFYEPHEPFSVNHINHFLLDALHHPQWQAQKSELHHSVIQILQSFKKAGFATDLKIENIVNLQDLQVVNIQNAGELYRIAKNHEQSQLKEAETVRVLPDGEERMISLVLSAQGQLNVRAYDRNVIIQNGLLVPLPPEQQIIYSPELDLVRDHNHWLRTPDHSVLKFRIGTSGVKGVVLSGATFKPTQTIDAGSLISEKRIFYPIKRLERFYIHRGSDPFYTEVLSLLEKAIEAIRLNAAGNSAFARRAFSSGQDAFENIFPDDKTLYRLLRELATTLTLKGISLVNENQKDFT